MTMANRNSASQPSESTTPEVSEKGAEEVSVVMTGSTYDAQNGDVVRVSAEQAERLIANGHAREPREGEAAAKSE